MFSKEFLLLVLCLIIGGLTNLTLAQEPADEYIGGIHFFDIEGEWVNEATEKRISRIVVKKTIVNTYRVSTYLAFGDSEEVFNKWEPLPISEENLAYNIEVASAECYIMPMIQGGKKILMIYSLIPDPDGGWIDKKIDVLVRQPDFTSLILPKTNIWELEGYWKSELMKGVVYSRIHVKQKNGSYFFDIYKMVNGKERLLSEKRLKRSDENGTHIVEWVSKDGDRVYTLYIRPVMKDMQLSGLDIVGEQNYSDGIPKKVFRQFYVRDPDAMAKEELAESIKNLEGTWLNLDPKGATNKIVVEDGDMEVFVNCEQGACPVGKGKLELQEDSQLIGSVTKRVLSYRITELETDLDMNKDADSPIVIVVDTTIEYYDENKDVEFFTEAFIKEGVQITSNLYNGDGLGIR